MHHKIILEHDEARTDSSRVQEHDDENIPRSALAEKHDGNDAVEENVTTEQGEGCRYPTRERLPPTMFTINSLMTISNGEEPAARPAMKGAESKKWQRAMATDIETLLEMRFW